jgi:hypothetical protein
LNRSSFLQIARMRRPPCAGEEAQMVEGTIFNVMETFRSRR